MEIVSEVIGHDRTAVLMLRLRGPLLFGDPANDLLTTVRAALPNVELPVVCDLSDVGIVDSSGLAALITAQEEVRRAGRHLVLLRPHARLRTMLEATQLDRRVDVAEDEAEALRRAIA
jgi:anti-anti-sigma factor